MLFQSLTYQCFPIPESSLRGIIVGLRLTVDTIVLCCFTIILNYLTQLILFCVTYEMHCFISWSKHFRILARLVGFNVRPTNFIPAKCPTYLHQRKQTQSSSNYCQLCTEHYIHVHVYQNLSQLRKETKHSSFSLRQEENAGHRTSTRVKQWLLKPYSLRVHRHNLFPWTIHIKTQLDLIKFLGPFTVY